MGDTLLYRKELFLINLYCKPFKKKLLQDYLGQQWLDIYNSLLAVGIEIKP